MMPVASADPNWFYSTLAQSTAAIVGLAGALLVSWTLARRSELAAERIGLRGRFVSWLQNQQGMRQEYANLEPGIRELARTIDAQRESGTREGFVVGPGQAYSLTHRANYSGAAVGPGAGADAAHLAALPAVAHDAVTAFTWDAKKLGKALRAGPPRDTGGASWLNDPREAAPLPVIAPYNYWEALDPRIQRDAVRGVWDGESRAYADLRADWVSLRSRIIPSSVYVLVAILIGLLAVGVVAPLSYLTAESGRSKSVLLVSFAVLAAAFGGYLIYEVNRLRRAADLTKDWF